MTRRPTLSLNEWAVLGLLVERPRHGYDIAAELRAGSGVGEVWRVTRPLVYRALDRLADLGLVEPRRHEPGPGPQRTVYGPTAPGRAELRAWLASPVDHLRDVRGGLLLKLVLARRLDVDTGDLVRAQARHFAASLAALAEPPERDDVVALWRHHSAAAVRTFLEALGADVAPPVTPARPGTRP